VIGLTVVIQTLQGLFNHNNWMNKHDDNIKSTIYSHTHTASVSLMFTPQNVFIIKYNIVFHKMWSLSELITAAASPGATGAYLIPQYNKMFLYFYSRLGWRIRQECYGTHYLKYFFRVYCISVTIIMASNFIDIYYRYLLSYNLQKSLQMY